MSKSVSHCAGPERSVESGDKARARLLCNGICMRAELAKRDAPVLRHHAPSIQTLQALVWVGLHACGQLTSFFP